MARFPACLIVPCLLVPESKISAPPPPPEDRLLHPEPLETTDNLWYIENGSLHTVDMVLSKNQSVLLPDTPTRR